MDTLRQPKILVSVVMPCYNSSRFITLAIESILTQTFRDFELIIVDDGSTDNTLQLIGQFEDSRINLIALGANHGNYFARNIGIKAARGKYIAMLDSDDIAESNRIEVQYKYLEWKRHVGAIGSNYYLINTSGDNTGKVHRDCKYPEFKIRLLQNNYMLQSTIMIRRNLIFRFNLFYELKYRLSSDYDFVARCSQCFPIYNIPEFLVRYRFHDWQLSSTQMSKQIEYSKDIRKELFFKLDDSVIKQGYPLVDKLMTKIPMSVGEIKSCVEVLDQLLAANKSKKTYHRQQLEKFFIEQIAINIYLQKKD